MIIIEAGVTAMLYNLWLVLIMNESLPSRWVSLCFAFVTKAVAICKDPGSKMPLLEIGENFGHTCLQGLKIWKNGGGGEH